MYENLSAVAFSEGSLGSRPLVKLQEMKRICVYTPLSYAEITAHSTTYICIAIMWLKCMNLISYHPARIGMYFLLWHFDPWLTRRSMEVAQKIMSSTEYYQIDFIVISNYHSRAQNQINNNIPL